MRNSSFIMLSVMLAARLVVGQEAADTETETEPAVVEEITPATEEKPVVIIETSLGNITLELWPDKAPATVENFLKYADDEFYDGLIFHRVIKNFMIQGGGFTPDMNQKPTGAQIKNEAKSEVPNKRGTIAMARTAVVDSATSQFFINLKDNAFLDRGARDFGYCVFGKVTDGMDIMDKIGAVATGNRGPFQDVPATDVVIKSIRRATAPE